MPTAATSRTIATALQRAVVRTLFRLPAPILVKLSGSEPHRVEGQVLDPQMQFGLALDARRGRTPLWEMTPAEARDEAAKLLAPFDAPRRDMADVSDLCADGGDGTVLARLYTPHRARPALLVYYHGGGAVIGSVEHFDRTCRMFADVGQLRVLSVDYRLAPEHPYPAAVDDAVAAYRWACDRAADLGADPTRIAVGGDSFGGNLAVNVSMAAAYGEVPAPAAQWLIYPFLDATLSQPSCDTFSYGYALERELMDWFVDHYLGDGDPRDPRVSPYFAADDAIAAMPQTLVVAAGYDPLRDEGRHFADRLQRAGVTVRYVCHEGLIHGFVQMTGAVAAARDAVRDAARLLGEAL